MLFHLNAIVFAYVDIDSDDEAIAAEQFQHRGRKNQRAAARDARLDDQIRLYSPDDFLHRNHVLRKLDNRPSEPGEVIRILELRNSREPLTREPPQRFVRAHTLDEQAVPLVKLLR